MTNSDGASANCLVSHETLLESRLGILSGLSRSHATRKRRQTFASPGNIDLVQIAFGFNVIRLAFQDGFKSCLGFTQLSRFKFRTSFGEQRANTARPLDGRQRY